MKTVLLISAALASASTFAHIEPGSWAGQTPAGAPCGFEAFEQTFENNLRHPLNERIRIRVNGDEFLIRHPYHVDAAKGLVTFDHDHFEGLTPMKGGSRAVVITMSHSESSEGPTAIRWIHHDWQAKKSATTQCSNLRHLK